MVYGLGFRVEGLGLRGHVLGFRVFGFRVQGSSQTLKQKGSGQGTARERGGGGVRGGGGGLLGWASTFPLVLANRPLSDCGRPWGVPFPGKKKGVDNWLWVWGEDGGGACSHNLYTFRPRPRRIGTAYV